MDISEDPELLALQGVTKFVKTVNVRGVWNDDSWAVLMTALDEKVFGMVNADLVMILEYRWLIDYAVLYLKKFPDAERSAELHRRVTEEVSTGIVACMRRGLAVEEQSARLRTFGNCLGIIRVLE